jgi:hypothetical protein
MTRAAEQGLRVIKPWGDSSRYDFVVELGARFLRVQVKSTSIHADKHYVCPLNRGRQKPYTSDDIDFVAVYIVPQDIWYIIPIDVVCGVRSGISLSPHNSLSKHAVYKEAWHLLREEESCGADTPVR